MLGAPTVRSSTQPAAPEQAPALPVPPHDRVGRDEGQVATPAGTPAASQDPQQLVPEAKPSMRSAASRTGQDGELMAQQQVLDHNVLARANPGQDCLISSQT